MDIYTGTPSAFCLQEGKKHSDVANDSAAIFPKAKEFLLLL
jgi:hypothetical protein